MKFAWAFSIVARSHVKALEIKHYLNLTNGKIAHYLVLFVLYDIFLTQIYARMHREPYYVQFR